MSNSIRQLRLGASVLAIALTAPSSLADGGGTDHVGHTIQDCITGHTIQDCNPDQLGGGDEAHGPPITWDGFEETIERRIAGLPTGHTRTLELVAPTFHAPSFHAPGFGATGGVQSIIHTPPASFGDIVNIDVTPAGDPFVQATGHSTPAPGVLPLLGLAALTGLRGRRRRA